LTAVIDLHCHALPGIDDGPATIEEALELARAQVAAGVRTVAATPHVSHHYAGNDAARIRAAVAELNAALAEAGIELEVVPGGEVALSRALELDDDELAALRLGGGPWLLAEAPMSPAAPAGVEHGLRRLADRGHRLLLAHPERCPVFLRDRDLLERLVASGMRCSITAAALTGRFGRDPQRFALGLLRDGLVHDVASDAHGTSMRRPPGLAEPLAQAGWGEHVTWLCDAAPRAILDGAPLPPPPAAAAPAPRGIVSRLLRRA
jgi:protein-tyrosine phosphatase